MSRVILLKPFIYMNSEPRPILTLDQIEALVMEQFPVMPGEKKCAFERNKMRELRQWKRRQLQQQNINNIAYNERLATGILS